MNFTFLKKLVVFAAIATLALQSCSDDPDPIRVGEDGFYVVNEGTFTKNNASLSYYDRATGQLTNDVFFLKNQKGLGDQVQSMTIIGNKGYVVVQGSNKIEVINADDFSSIVTIKDGLTSPRYILAVSSTKAYVSDWGTGGVNGTIKVLDLNTNTITKTIDKVGTGTNRMIKVNNLVYAANSGGYGLDSTIAVVDINTDVVTKKIEAGYNPNSLQVDKSGNLWVASTGKVNFAPPDYFEIDETTSVAGSITKFKSDLTEEFSVSPSRITYSGLSSLSISTDGAHLYYLYDDAIYKMSTSANTRPQTPFRTVKTGSYYGLAVDPFDNSIIGCIATPDFNSAGSIEIIDANGSVTNTFTAGISPNGCAFK